MKDLFVALLLSIVSITGYAQKWIDVTDEYIINPRFDGDDRETGWEGTQLQGWEPAENAEFWNWSYYDTYQSISGLPSGKYRLSLDAFYRMGNSEEDYNLYLSGNYAEHQLVYMYAISSIAQKTKNLEIFSKGAINQPLGGRTLLVGNNLYVPDNMEAAHYWFEKGYYKNSMEVEVGDDGNLTIGFRKSDDFYVNGDWTCLDNWKLEMWGDVINVNTIVLSENNLELVPTEKCDLIATTYPTDATYRNVTWTSTNDDIAIVNNNGQITAKSLGECDIVATAKDDNGKTALCHVIVKNNNPTAENIIINEIMAANVDVYLDPSQNYGSWVELYNPTDMGVSLGGLYVSDDPHNLKKHRLIDSYGVLPAKGYALLNFDHHEVWTPYAYRQIDDKLDCDGGMIIISDGTKVIAQQEYPPVIVSRTSYARIDDDINSKEWGFTGNPSPSASNKDCAGFADEVLDAPTVDKDAQIFEGSLSICVNYPHGTILKYTTDGTAPTLTNGYISETGLFTVTETTCYRFRIFKEGYLPSQVITRTYINSSNEPFPIISVVTDNNNIYGWDYGVFQQGETYGRPGNGRSNNCNWNMDWDRPVSFEYITTDNKCLISQECDLSMCGGWSRANNPHSFKLKAKKTYDFNNSFKAQFFNKKPYIKNKTLQIRNGGNDGYARLMDPALQQIVARSGIYVDYQEWQPVHVYINGQSYAVLNMREPNNKDFAESNYGIDTDEMDQFEITPDSNYVQMKGTEEAYLRLINLSKNATDTNIYKEIEKLLDIDEYINYMAVELYTGNWDWPQNNTKGFRDVHDGKFHFVIFDLDGALSTSTPFNTFLEKEKNFTFPTNDDLHGYDYSRGVSIEGIRYKEDLTFVTLFKNLLKNDNFRKKFIDTFCIVGGSVFHPKKVNEIVDEMSNYLAQGDYVYPWNTANNLKSGFSSRNVNMINHIQNVSEMALSTIKPQSVLFSTNVPESTITINDIKVPYNYFEGYLFAPVTLKAVAPIGYRFSKWETTKTSTTSKSIFETSSDWKYYDKGSLDGKNWETATYNDNAWKIGTAGLGYDLNNWLTGVNTTITEKLSTYYFRKSFTLENTPTKDSQFMLNYTVDDGMIVYVNGLEAGRYNMPDGTVDYNTFSYTYSEHSDQGSMPIPTSFFKRGENVIAVEVHNNNETSSDAMWDASLMLITSKNETSFSCDEEYTLPKTGEQNVTAIFEKIPAAELVNEDITPVRINEVSATNSIYINDHYKKNDWLELYNTTDADIDIKGMNICLVTDKSKKEKRHDYQVPSDNVTLNTIIPAHGYKVIWCDKLDIIGADIHTGFKLETKGGDVIIATDSYNDTLTYEQHLGTQTFGRYPDGANDVYAMNTPTIAKTNRIGSYDTLYVKPVEQTDPDAIQSYTKEGGITIAYVNGAVNIKSEDSSIRTADIYSMAGMKMATTSFANTGNKFMSINVATLPKGIYLVSATTEDGDECHIKFIIK